MPENDRILIIGGTGHFGGRICRRLAKVSGIELLVSGRSRGSVDALVGEIRQRNPGAVISGITLDLGSTNIEAELGKLLPTVVVHTAGPYQGQDYRVACACIEVKSHYVDLADGRKFVENFTSLDKAARDNGVLLVTGASTLPGVSMAVIDVLQANLSRVDDIEISIAPAHQTPRGPGTVASVLSYCGRPFVAMKAGEWQTVYGWQDLRIQSYPDLGRRLSGACDVPDLSLLPARIPGLRNVSFHAALEAPWEQMSLWLMAWMTRLCLVSDWPAHASFFVRLSRRLESLGSVQGGMHVRLVGDDLDGRPASYTWYLTARSNHGPEIPCTPCIVLVKKLVQKKLQERGAFPCHGFLTIYEIMDELSDFSVSSKIVAGIRN